jgi:hypothetical protein
MSATGDIVRALILTNVRNYPVEAFHDLNMQRILLLLLDMAEGLQGGAIPPPNPIAITSADFINATDAPLPTLNGFDTVVFWNEANRYLWQDRDEWEPLPGGGFRVTLADFDSTADNYHFVITPLNATPAV